MGAFAKRKVFWFDRIIFFAFSQSGAVFRAWCFFHACFVLVVQLAAGKQQREQEKLARKREKEAEKQAEKAQRTKTDQARRTR